MMFCHACTQHSAAEISANQELYGARIAVRRRGFKNGGDGLIVLTGDIDAVCTFAQRRSIHQKAAVLQGIIVAIGRQNLIK